MACHTKETSSSACPVDPSCLGMCSWTNCPGNADSVNFEPHPISSGSKPLPLTSCKLQPASRLERFAVVTDQELAKLAEGLTPLNTAKTTSWALKNFQQWKTISNQSHPTDQVPDDIFITTNPQILNNHLSRFIVETRKANGDLYPPSTLHQLLCGILRHMRNKNPACPNFLDKKDNRFRQLHGTLDSYFHKLHSEGIGRQTKHAEVVSSEEEDQLWKEGIMDVKTPTGIQNAAFFVVGKMFCLRGGQEHRGLQLSQLKRYEDKYVYFENVSKNRNGSFKQLRVKNKTVPLYPTPEAGERCPVHILDMYIRKLPSDAKDKDLFYVRPLERIASNPNAPWYSSVPLGKHTLHSKLKNMCAGIKGHKTNHSLRATAATEMFRHGAPEKLIQERTGHRSLDALRSYERLDEVQHKAVSSILSNAPGKSRSMTFSQCMSTKTHTNNMSSTSYACAPHIPTISLQSLHECTINFNCTPQPMPHAQVTNTEEELDELISLVDIPY